MNQRYHVFDPQLQKWLADDERSWTTDFNESACFFNANIAQYIGDREAKEKQEIFVMCVE